MAMHIGVARVALHLPANASLKGKRMVVRSVAQRVRNRFNVAVAEIDLDPGPAVHVSISGIFRGLVSGDRGNDHLRLDILAGGEGGTYDLSELGGMIRNGAWAGTHLGSNAGARNSRSAREHTRWSR